jgi:hypothetical protein
LTNHDFFFQEFSLRNTTVGRGHWLCSGQFHYRRAAFSSQLKSKCGNLLTTAETLRIILNIDDTPV